MPRVDLFTLNVGSAPSIAAGAGAGTGPTVSVVAGSTDRAGTVSVTTGTSPTAAGVVATVTFSSAKAAAPTVVILTPGNVNGAALQSSFYVSSKSATGFVIQHRGTSLTAAVNYQLFYLVI